jgi:hypothetical protein
VEYAESTVPMKGDMSCGVRREYGAYEGSQELWNTQRVRCL